MKKNPQKQKRFGALLVLVLIETYKFYRGNKIKPVII